jgi:hypothetical protein
MSKGIQRTAERGAMYDCSLFVESPCNSQNKGLEVVSLKPLVWILTQSPSPLYSPIS